MPVPEDRILKKVDLLEANGERVPERIIRESSLTVLVNGQRFATAMLLAGMEKEYAAGLLCTQGIIRDAADILSINVSGNTVDVRLTADPEPKPRGPVVSGLTVPCPDVFDCVRAILKSPVFEETEAVHSAGLFPEGKQAVAITEDIGRHHAFDKAVGKALLAGVDFSRTLAASTGRQPLEMITRCRNAGIPVIATKGVPTTLAVELAEASGITIAGLVRGDTMTIYSHPERII